MSLNSILNTATSGLQSNQTALRVTSNNIANVNTQGYHRRAVDFGPQVTAGKLHGVQIDEVRRIADDFLAREATSSTGALGKADVLASYFKRVQDLVGSLNGGSSLDSRISGAMTALTQLSVDPASLARRSSALSAVTSAMSSISAMAANVQTLRQDANAQLTTDVSSVNGLLAKIYELNTKVKIAVGGGDTSTALLDQRDMAVADLSKYLDIRTFDQSDGRVFVALGDGTSLINDLSSELRYVSPTAVASSTSFPSLNLQRTNPEGGTDAGPPTALEGRIRSGEIRGLIDLRDKALPDLAEQLGALASSITEQLNAVHNDSSAVPPPASLNGRNTGLSAGDALNFSGRATVAVVDSQGKLVQRLDLDLSTLSTVADLVNAINAGLGGTATASFSNGALSIAAAGAGNGVAMMQDPATPASRGGRGLSQFFGLNDLVSGASPSSFATGVAAADAHGFTPGGTAQFVLRGADGAVIRNFSMTVGGATVADVVTDLNTAAAGTATFALDANGNLSMTPSGAYAGARLEVTNDTTARGTTGVGLSQFFGLGTAMRQNQAAGLSVRSDIAANGSKLALAQLDLSASTVVGDRVLGISDNRGAVRLAQIANAAVSISNVGGLAGGQMSISDYTALIMSKQSDALNTAASESVFRQDVHEEAVSRRTAVEGVNLDEELSNMMIFQQAYNASARLISVVQQMYDTLLNAV
ncbi:MAG: flagellar hook-associated protein FlgK [Alphaproteobacteria bacterium]|nr:flagellar hook-associated protein FlgK [Alphaproteobacteria bacterium]